MSTLFGIGVWGHRTHWSLAGAGHAPPSNATAHETGSRGIDAPAAGTHAPAAGEKKSTPADQIADTTGTTPAANNAASGTDVSGHNPASGGTVELPLTPSDVIERAPLKVTRIAGSGAELLKLPSAGATRRAQLVIERATQSQLDEFVAAHGVTTYNQNKVASLSARVPGMVWRVEKEVGQVVRKGDVLAVLDSSEVGKAKAEFLQSVVNLHLKTMNLGRLKSVSDVVSERQLREAEADAREAKLRLFNAEQVLINLGMPIRPLPDETDESVAERIHFLGLPAELTAGLDPKTTTANLIPIIAPFDGVVIDRQIVPGEVVEPSQPQFMLADVSQMWVEFHIPFEAANQLRPGQTVQFEPEGVFQELHCQLDWIGTELDDKTRTILARAVVENPVLTPGEKGRDGVRSLRAKIFGTARIRVRESGVATVVPKAAVQFDGKRHFVFMPVTEPDTFEVVPIKTGINQGDQIEVIEGVRPGDLVVVQGSRLLKSELLRISLARNDAP